MRTFLRSQQDNRARFADSRWRRVLPCAPSKNRANRHAISLRKTPGSFEENAKGRTMKQIFDVAIVGLCFGISLTSTAFAQTAKDLVGTWVAISNVNIGQDGRRVDVFGPRAKGVAIFESNHHFAIVNIDPDTPKFVSNRRSHGTPEEYKAAVLGGIALFGTYWVSNKTIFFTVEGSTYPNWTGTEQVRTVVHYTDNELTWSLASSIGGTSEVVWKRVR
jgi:lipocalin-like protein